MADEPAVNDMPEPTRRPIGRRMVRAFLMLAVPAAVLCGAVQYYLATGGTVDTENAYVKARLHNISTEIDGLVKFVLVDENDRVIKGQMLLELDPEPYEIAIRAAEAELASIRQDIESRRWEYRRSAVDIELAKKRIAFLTTRHERQKKLRATGVASVARLDEAEFELQIAKEELRAAQERRRQLLADLGGDPDTASDKLPSVRRAQAAVDRALLDLRR
ncbi:MAG: biotin/lipoyl-binding protein, partial [Rhodospirillaceae bacterium]